MDLIWKPLSTSGSAADLPPLLISSAFNADSYTVYLTDLIRIWSETLDHKSILRRSQREGTSIDPSDRDQLQIFLDKIKSGIDGDKSTTFTVAFESEGGRPVVTLQITVKLPGGLTPLEWPIYLNVAPQSLLTGQLTIPLLEAQHLHTQELASLAQVIKEKDHVIQKLVDKLEEQGTQLGHAFPQAAGKGGRKVDRKQAEAKVKGLGPFDIDSWKKDLDLQKSQDSAHLVQDVFGSKESEGLKFPASIRTHVRKDDWWETIKGETIKLSSNTIGTTVPSKAKELSRPTLKADTSIDDDGFQVQATPPPASSTTPKRPASEAVEDDSSDDDDDLNDQSQPYKIPDSFPLSPPPAVSPPKSKKIGKVGGKKQVSNPLPPVDDDSTEDDAQSRAPSPPKENKLGIVGGKKQTHKPPLPVDDETTDEEDPSPAKHSSHNKTKPPEPPSDSDSTTDDENPSPAKRTNKHQGSPTPPPAKKKGGIGKIGGKKVPPPPPKESTPPPAEPVKPKKGKLGLIGGKKKATAPASESSPAPSSFTTNDITPAKKKLGTIGGRGKTPTNKASATPEVEGSNEARGRSVKVEREETPPPQETEEERADKKRLQLKRELEAKARLPVKKKRKF